MIHLFHFLDDILFPARCIICGRDGTLLCKACTMTFPFASQTCPFCDAITDGLTCKKCSQTKKLNGAISLFDYEHPGVQKLIAHIKYRGLFSLIATLTADTEDVLVSYENLFPLSAALVPAPLRKTSFIERGFNQAEVIAKMVSKITGMRISKNLAFSSRIRPQHLLSQNARWEKIDNRVTVRYLAKDIKHAIVVDDLLTTGATLESCAQALSQAGVKRITGFTLARQKKLFR